MRGIPEAEAAIENRAAGEEEYTTDAKSVVSAPTQVLL